MSAAKTQAAIGPAAETLESISLIELRPASWNARKTRDEAGMQELCDSIRQFGQQVPLLVRPLPHSPAAPREFEIVCGHRRFDAILRVLGVDAQASCIVRALTDDEAQEIGLVDNVQREDVPAMELAQTFAVLLTRLGSVAAVAQRVQKEQSFVAQRLKLCSCSDQVKRALNEGLIGVDHATVLARYGAAEQDLNLKWCIDHSAGSKMSVEKVIDDRLARRKENEERDPGEYRWRHTWEPQSVQKLKDHIAGDTGIELSRAPWDLDVTYLGEAPACNECPQNTRANAPLFGDLEIGEATCTDGACFKEKTQAFVRIQARASDGIDAPLRVSWKTTSTAPRFEKVFLCKCGAGRNCQTGEGCRGVPQAQQTFKAGQWVEAKKKSCEHVRSGITVDWNDANDRGYMGGEKKLRKPGEIVSVCVAADCKKHPKAWAKTKSSDRSGSGGIRNENSAESKAEREQLAIAAKAENELRLRVVSEALAKVTKISGELLRRIVLAGFDEWIGPEDQKRFPALKKSLKLPNPDSAEFARAAASTLLTGDRAYEALFFVDEENEASEGRKELIALLKDFGYDASKAWEKPKPTKKTAAKKAPKAAAKKGGRK